MSGVLRGAAAGAPSGRRAAPKADRAVLLKHLPTLLASVVAAVVVAVAPDTVVTDGRTVLAAAAVMALATALAVLAVLRPSRARRRDPEDAWGASDGWAVVVPLLSVLSIGLLRAGTGGSGSLFGSMLVLPLIWIAAEPGRWAVLLAAGASCLALLLPWLPWLPGAGTGEADALAPWRAVFVPFVYALAALTVNELARRLRGHLARLHSADRLTRSVLDAVTEQAVIGTGLDGLVDVWNPGAAALLGRSPAQAQGRVRIDEVVLPAELHEQWRRTGTTTPFEALVAGVAPGRPDVTEWTWLRANGSHVPVQVSVTVRQDGGGRPVGYLFVATDASRVHEAARLQEQFTGMISHELRTPVSAMLGHLELLRDDPLTADQERSVEVAERNAHRLLRLVDDLLLTARVDAGGFPLALEDVDVAEVARAAVVASGPVADRAGVRLDLDVPDAPVPLRADPGRLAQVCDNLVSNALKLTPAGGSVTVRVTSGVDHVRIAVADTGLGIPADEVDRLFGRFFRTSTATRNAVPGVGLGLAITRSIVVAHGGAMEVASVEGEGATFTAVLPRRRAV
ncbi:sensor histidine kinase [Cellulomonas hominis]|uniref:sensor histidine kinase n=1 Tax=Cellulomonas hominis TaxID=156981 RepID=UPI001B92A898|nr:PAS domain-containing sensor histidine kinase [Cellulomonas hominis]VTR77841.1 Sensor histidine kinase ResE [Cellulomonas hominis]